MLTRAHIRGMHMRTVLRSIYHLKGRRASTSTEPTLLTVVYSTPPKAMDSDAAARYHLSNQHGR